MLVLNDTFIEYALSYDFIVNLLGYYYRIDVSLKYVICFNGKIFFIQIIILSKEENMMTWNSITHVLVP